MIKLHHYTQEKFRGFAPEKQIKAMLELLSALEKNITNTEYVSAITIEILNCLEWLNPALQEEFQVLAELNQFALRQTEISVVEQDAVPAKNYAKQDRRPALQSKFANPHDIIRLIAPFLNRYKPNQAESEADILRFDGLNSVNQAQSAPYPLTVILDNLRSAYNVGSIFRTAECVQACELILCGITPTPPHPKLLKTAMQTIDRMNWQYLAETEAAIALMKSRGIPVIALETTSDAVSLFDYKVTQPIGLILGNEALGIEEFILRQADLVLSIPVLGWKNSLNVCNAFAIAAYHLSGLGS